MSIIRVRHPHRAPADVDLGPNLGRVTHTRAGITGGALVVAESQRSRDLRLAREASKRGAA